MKTLKEKKQDKKNKELVEEFKQQGVEIAVGKEETSNPVPTVLVIILLAIVLFGLLAIIFFYKDDISTVVDYIINFIKDNREVFIVHFY